MSEQSRISRIREIQAQKNQKVLEAIIKPSYIKTRKIKEAFGETDLKHDSRFSPQDARYKKMKQLSDDIDSSDMDALGNTQNHTDASDSHTDQERNLQCKYRTACDLPSCKCCLSISRGLR